MSQKLMRLLVMLTVLGLLAAACGSTVDSATDAATDAVDEAVDAVDGDEEEAMEDEEEAMEDEEEAMEDEESEEAAVGAYEGETIEVLIPFGAGGGTDTWGRAIAPFFEQYLGEDVTVSVFNDETRTAAVSTFAQATERDGLTVFVNSGSISIPFLLQQEGVNYDFADFTGIIGSPVGGIVYVNTSTGIESVEDLCTTDVDLFLGAQSLAALDAVPALAFDLLGVEVNILQGLEGTGPIRTGFEAGDFNITTDTSASNEAVQELVDAGIATPLFTYGITQADGTLGADATWPELPTMADAFETCNGEAPSGEAWEAFLAINTAGFAAQKNIWVHNDAPADRIAALQEAAAQIVVDPEFTALATDLIGAYQFVAGEDLDSQFAAASNLDPAANAFLCDFLQTEHNVGGICGG